MDATAEDCGKPPLVEVNRVAVAKMKGKGLSIDFLKHSLFSTAWKQLQSISSYKLRPPRPHGTDPFLAFEVLFKEEQVVGEAGPWRQFFTDCAKELQEGNGSPLLIKCPNGMSGIGDNREKYVLRPSSTSSPLLSLYQFLGILMGESIRTGVRFPLDLPPFIWKSLVNEPLSRNDLLAIDKPAYDQLLMMEAYDEGTLQSLERTFVTQLSDATQVELKENGIETPVTIHNRSEYISLVLAARLSESSAQIDAIRTGLSKIIPLQLFHLLTWPELEILICGKSNIDIDLLKRHTVYSGGLSAESSLIENFWTVLEEFDEYHRKLFIRFAWAQDRLLADDAEFVRSHTRLMIKPASHHQPDQALPHSDTCFFNVSLPNYSSLAIMRTKLLYAITTCTSMNADEQPQDDQERGRRGRFGEEDDF